VDAPDPGPQWWQPKVGEAKNWDIQLNAPIDVSAPRAMYDLDLWALVPSPTTLDYGDGKAPVTVPAGKLAGTIAQLHARTPSTIVICHVDTGILDLTLPDAPKFPGYNADPAMIPDQTAPAAGSVIGWHVGLSMRRWLDIREASRAKLVPIIFKRFDLARQIGCDGVDPDFNQAAAFSSFTGFSPTAFDSYSWHDEIAKQGHDRLLSTGMKNGDLIMDQVDKAAGTFDWLIIERCGELQTCDVVKEFITMQKAVFAIDYDHDSINDPPQAQASSGVCQGQTRGNIIDGIYKDVELTSKVRTQCVP
jgi:hypothetical protein